MDDAPPLTPSPQGAQALEIAELAPGGADQPLGVVAAAMLVGAVALMVLGVQPVLLGELAQAGRVSGAEVGPLATAEILALALGAGVGPGWMARGAIRAKTLVLCLLLVGVDLAIRFAGSALALDALRGAAGLIEGLLVGACVAILIRDRRPDRLNAIFLALSTLPQAVMAYLLPAWIAPRWGADGGFFVLAGLAVIGATTAPFLPDTAPSAGSEASGKPVWTAAIFVALLAVGLQNAAIGGAWDYMQLLADQRLFPAEIAGIAVAGGLVFQVGGALAVAVVGHRFPYRGALVLGALAQAGVIALLAVAGTPVAYLLPALAFGLFWLALSPFQVRLLIALDPTRSAAVLLTAVTLVGLSLGPALSALGVRGRDVAGAFWIAAALMAAAAALYAGLALSRRPS